MLSVAEEFKSNLAEIASPEKKLDGNSVLAVMADDLESLLPC